MFKNIQFVSYLLLKFKLDSIFFNIIDVFYILAPIAHPNKY